MERCLHIEKLDKHISKSDGTRKKVILYNLGTAKLLRDGEKLLNKMERNLKAFEENADDVFVIFSIQSGIENNTRLIHAELVEDLNKVVEDYRNAPFCLFIDYENMDEIYDICDAYYGDWGIGAWRCRQMGKPIMIQNAEV